MAAPQGRAYTSPTNWLLAGVSMEVGVVLAPRGDWFSMAASGFAFPPQVPLSME